LNWKKYKNKEFPKDLKEDKIAYYLMFFALFYYFMDSAFTVLAWRF